MVKYLNSFFFSMLQFLPELRDRAIKSSDAFQLQLQHFPAKIGDHVNLPFFLFPDEGNQAVLFHFGKAAVHCARRKVNFPVGKPLNPLNDSVAMVRLPQTI